jgi:putative intracellular protease/amidase
MYGFDPRVPDSFEQTADSAIYRHFQSYRHNPLPPLLEALAQRIHDHAIDDALAQLLADPAHQRVVGVMGGHALKRGADDFSTIAHIAWALAKRGYFIATGGGPGAMEAANLGAWMSAYSEADLGQALSTLAAATNYRAHEYLLAGYRVLDAYPDGASSLAIPTWFYGHEPSNQFACHIAKYFSNSLREDGLLAIAKHGVIYAPGSAGTVQEVFMDAAQNHYGTFELVSPMVFVGSEEWTDRRPIMPLLSSLCRGKQYAAYIALLDEVDDVVDFIEGHPPVRYEA